MDSRPAMAIFELLDYIVNEVCVFTFRYLSGTWPAHPVCLLGEGMSWAVLCSPQSESRLRPSWGLRYSAAQAGSLSWRSVWANLGQYCGWLHTKRAEGTGELLPRILLQSGEGLGHIHRHRKWLLGQT